MPANGVELLSRGPMAAYLLYRYFVTSLIIIEYFFVAAAAMLIVFSDERLSLNLLY